MHAPASRLPQIWNRALVWSEHDAWMARRRARQVVLICIAILVLAVGFAMASYAFNQLVLAAMSPQGMQSPPIATATALVPHTPPRCTVPPITWFPTW
jgi:Mn2+/Fe2+ NRAMP family transporter